MQYGGSPNYRAAFINRTSEASTGMERELERIGARQLWERCPSTLNSADSIIAER